jgi:hypothetical protein
VPTLRLRESLPFQTKTAYNDNETAKIGRPIIVTPRAVAVGISAKLPASAVSDTSPMDSGIPDNEITTSQTQASNSSTSATITITMYAVADE